MSTRSMGYLNTSPIPTIHETTLDKNSEEAIHPMFEEIMVLRISVTNLEEYTAARFIRRANRKSKLRLDSLCQREGHS